MTDAQLDAIAAILKREYGDARRDALEETPTDSLVRAFVQGGKVVGVPLAQRNNVAIRPTGGRRRSADTARAREAG
jgi:hypothetical protein